MGHLAGKHSTFTFEIESFHSAMGLASGNIIDCLVRAKRDCSVLSKGIWTGVAIDMVPIRIQSYRALWRKLVYGTITFIDLHDHPCILNEFTWWQTVFLKKATYQVGNRKLTCSKAQINIPEVVVFPWLPTMARTFFRL